MKRTKTPAVELAERLCRPQRVGVLGHRGVGKTTFLTMLYREAVAGRLPGLRLAAADARTAGYLSDKLLQLEGGEPLPATLGETELRFHLYHQRDNGGEMGRLELLLMDYQGEHVAVGRQEPVRDFLRDCDAVWLCLEAPAVSVSTLEAEQEVEQAVEDYLAALPSASPPRPTALVVTKADLLGTPERFLGAERDPEALAKLVAQRFAMTEHALRLHSPTNALLALSSLGGPLEVVQEPAAGTSFQPRPAGLEGPLHWLTDGLRAQDEARLARLWELAPNDLPLLERCVEALVRRHPQSPVGPAYRQRLRERRRQRRRNGLLAGAAVAACLVLGLWRYDAWGEAGAQRFAAEHPSDPQTVQQYWRSYQVWHPTRHLFRPTAAQEEEQRLRDLETRISDYQRRVRLSHLRQQVEDADADPEAAWTELQAFHADFPDAGVPDWQELREALKARRDRERERRARLAFEELEQSGQQADLVVLVEQSSRFLGEHAGTTFEPRARRLRQNALHSLDERDINAARVYSAEHPLNFHTRGERYQNYLERHPEGAFIPEATGALTAIRLEWDKHDFRAVRDAFRDRPGDVDQLAALCRAYLAAHPQGQFRGQARELIRWGERVSEPGDYHVVLRSGSFDRSVAAFFSRGPSLSVVVEVNGVAHGPSTIVSRSYQPEWNYEFPRPIRWKRGDSVRILVTDNYYWRRNVAQLTSENFDPLGLRLLTGEIHCGSTTLRFDSDFVMPSLPNLE